MFLRVIAPDESFQSVYTSNEIKMHIIWHDAGLQLVLCSSKDAHA